MKRNILFLPPLDVPTRSRSQNPSTISLPFYLHPRTKVFFNPLSASFLKTNLKRPFIIRSLGDQKNVNAVLEQMLKRAKGTRSVTLGLDIYLSGTVDENDGLALCL
jgi:hypothetical protein